MIVAIKRKARAERGQTMAELALCLPVMCLVLLAIIQLGIVFRNYVTLTDAVRAGARQAAVSRSLTNPVAAADSAVRRSAGFTGDLRVTVTPGATPWSPGQDVTVTATYPYEINLLGVVFRSGRLSSSTTERVE